MVHCCMSLIQPSVTSKNVTHVCIGVAILAPLCDVSKRGKHDCMHLMYDAVMISDD